MQSIVQQTLQNTMYHRNIPLLIYKINYPRFTTTCSSATALKINHHYTQAARHAETYCRTVLYPTALESAGYIQNGRPFNSFTFEMTYTITYNSGCITSLYMETYEYMGGAHGETTRTSETWSFRTGNQLHLKDIYPVTPASLSRIQAEMRDQIAVRRNLSPGSYFDDYAVLLQTHFNPGNFYLIPDNFVLYYQQYEIAPYATGIAEFSFPLAPLNP